MRVGSFCVSGIGDRHLHEERRVIEVEARVGERGMRRDNGEIDLGELATADGEELEVVQRERDVRGPFSLLGTGVLEREVDDVGPRFEEVFEDVGSQERHHARAHDLDLAEERELAEDGKVDGCDIAFDLEVQVPEGREVEDGREVELVIRTDVVGEGGEAEATEGSQHVGARCQSERVGAVLEAAKLEVEVREVAQRREEGEEVGRKGTVDDLEGGELLGVGQGLEEREQPRDGKVVERLASGADDNKAGEIGEGRGRGDEREHGRDSVAPNDGELDVDERRREEACEGGIDDSDGHVELAEIGEKDGRIVGLCQTPRDLCVVAHEQRDGLDVTAVVVEGPQNVVRNCLENETRSMLLGGAIRAIAHRRTPSGSRKVSWHADGSAPDASLGAGGEETVHQREGASVGSRVEAGEELQDEVVRRPECVLQQNRQHPVPNNVNVVYHSVVGESTARCDGMWVVCASRTIYGDLRRNAECHVAKTSL